MSKCLLLLTLSARAALLTMCLLGGQGALAEAIRPLTMVVLGDSLSAAYGLKEQQGWVYRLTEELAEREPPITVINASISGATTAQGLARLPALLQGHRPDFLLLELGGNDGLQGKPVASVETNLRALIEMADTAGAQVVLFGMQLPPNLGPRYTEPFRTMFARLAQQYQLAYVPFLLEGVALDPDLMQEDGIHPTAAARDAIYQNVWPVLKPLIEQEQF